MVCNRICVSHFRNIEHAEVVFEDGVNVLAGANAQGKTNLLEAIFYTSIGNLIQLADKGIRTVKMPKSFDQTFSKVCEVKGE